MTHTWTHNPSRIIRSEHLFSLTHPPFHQKMHLSIFASHVSLNTLFTCFFFFFFYESYLQSVWGVCVCIAELECLRMSEICNFTVSFYKRPVGTSSPLALSFSCISPACQSTLRVYRAVPPSANLYLLFPPLNTDNQPLNCAFNAGFTDGCLSLSLSRSSHCDNRRVWQ